MSPDSEGLGAAVVAAVGLNSESEGLGAAVIARRGFEPHSAQWYFIFLPIQFCLKYLHQ